MILYRAIPTADFQPGIKIQRVSGRRLRGNIPYLVDNLWEFSRPEALPSRRHAVYASPTPELALANASVFNVAPGGYVACRLEFHIEPPMVQLAVPDARQHPDVGHLQKLVNKRLSQWAASDLATKQSSSALFLPGVTKEELQAAMTANEFLAELVTEAAATVRLWQSVPAPDGELFFEIAADNYYVLHAL